MQPSCKGEVARATAFYCDITLALNELTSRRRGDGKVVVCLELYITLDNTAMAATRLKDDILCEA
ncbi:hypothetical protein GSF04_08850 [Pseudoalteromonas sp. A22]|uniref:hypothetical protein n=1 Tax=Pseudoalteromonas sp. A22 TaxID=327511 RepID=UPI001BACED61|nr:hypothetical protein [Pseudoalteromonas sp. A22]QUI62615.1 hypothetical protein GSF04_08850 [Pseudoalteromonas sp. A22]